MIAQRDIERDGVTYTVTVSEDPDSQPQDFDCYDAASIKAWTNDEWRYVTVTVATEDGREANLSGVEYGQVMPDRWIGLDEIIKEPYMDVRAQHEETYTSYTMVDSLISELTEPSDVGHDKADPAAEFIAAHGWTTAHALRRTIERLTSEVREIREELTAADADPEVMAKMVGLFGTYNARKVVADMAAEQITKYEAALSSLTEAMTAGGVEDE